MGRKRPGPAPVGAGAVQLHLTASSLAKLVGMGNPKGIFPSGFVYVPLEAQGLVLIMRVLSPRSADRRSPSCASLGDALGGKEQICALPPAVGLHSTEHSWPFALGLGI